MIILTYYGSTDGIRWGDVGWSNFRRRYHWDRIADRVRLWDISGMHLSNKSLVVEDLDPVRLTAVRALLEGRP